MPSPRPIVAIDGRFLQHDTYSRRGIGRLTRELAAWLPRAAGDLRFVIVGAGDRAFDLGAGGAPASGIETAVYARPLAARRARVVKLALLAEEPAFRRTLERIGASAVLVPTQHGMFPAARTPRVLLFLDAIPYLFPEREMPSWHLRLFYAITALGARQARAVVAISRSAALEAARLLGVRPSRISVAHLGVDPSFRGAGRGVEPAASAELRARLGLPARFLLHVGGFDARKNVDGLLDAFGRIASRAPDVHLVLAGRAEEHEREALSRRLAALGGEAAARVRVLGFVPEAELPALLGAASALAFASRHEGFGLPVLEALACGLPVVAFDNSSIPEIAGDAALLVEDGDHGALADALLRVVSDAALAADLRGRGPRQAARFTWDETARRVALVLREVVGR